MVLTPYAETLRERTRNTAFEARALLRPALGIRSRRAGSYLHARANDGFVEAFGPALIAAAAEQAPRVQLRCAKPEKSDRPLREGLVDLEIGVLGDMGRSACGRCSRSLRRVMRSAHPLAPQRNRRHRLRRLRPWWPRAQARILGPVDAALGLGLTRQIAAVVPSFPARAGGGAGLEPAGAPPPS
ncbi:hypothetical protein M8494_10980 [Serratia ureilytica]